MSRKFLLGTLGAALFLGLAACSDSTAPMNGGADAQADADIAATTADGVTETVNLFAGNEGTLDDMTSVSPSISSTTSAVLWRFIDRCDYDSSLGRFVCPTAERGPLTIERSFGLADALGQPMDHFDGVETASANFLLTLTGDVRRDDWSASIDRQQSVTLSGLAGEESAREWNGTGNTTVHSVHEGDQATRTYDASHSVAIEHVVVNLPRSENPWPASGTITVTVSARQTIEGAADRLRQFQRVVTVTFNGTQFVPLQVGSRQFTLDLATGEVTPAA
ncbi:MAG TPA: hypothetical protein VFK13_04375 [Gemmatimonadaceae bacterium]|nr:hypothetical protein [Gemmatimonadaceae bacterium]